MIIAYVKKYLVDFAENIENLIGGLEA